jgi:hypothetical protein
MLLSLILKIALVLEIQLWTPQVHHDRLNDGQATRNQVEAKFSGQRRIGVQAMGKGSHTESSEAEKK